MIKKTIGLVWVSALLLAGCQTTQKSETNGNNLELASPTMADPSPTVTITLSPTASAGGNLNINIKEKNTAMQATIKTTKGEIKIKLYPETAPKTVANFTAKAKSDYYKNLTFHRVEDWVIQGGDPEGTGRGGGDMDTEFSQVAFKEGSLGVARGPIRTVSNDSQFFICTKDCSWLTGEYTNFGEVSAGMEVAKNMAVGDKILGITLE